MKGSPPLDHLLSSITALLPEQELFSYFPLCKINITHVKWITEFYAVRNLYIVTCEYISTYCECRNFVNHFVEKEAYVSDLSENESQRTFKLYQ